MRDKTQTIAMISKIQRDFLVLFKCIIDFGADVLRDFTEEKITAKFPLGFCSAFLKENKHHLYHQWNKEKISCCECPINGCNIPKTGKMYKKIFDKYYVFDNSFHPPRGHVIRKDKCVLQKCICQYTERTISINEIDICDIKVLLLYLNLISPTEESLLEELMSVRGKVCHAVNSETFSEPELSTLWSTFTGVLYKICQNDRKYLNILQKAIEATKRILLSDVEIKELMEKIDDVSNEVHNNVEEMKHLIKHGTTEIKNCIIEKNTGLKNHFDETLKPMAKQQKVNELLQENEKRICETVQQTQEDVVTKVANESLATREYMGANHAVLEGLMKQMIALVGRHPVHVETRSSDITTQSECERENGNIQLTSTITQPSLTEDIERKIIDSLPNEIDIKYDDTNDDEVYAKQTLQIKAKKVNSIVLEINATRGIFKSPTTLRSAVRTLVEKVLDEGEVDKNAEDPIIVTLSFKSTLTEDEKTTVINLLNTKYENRNEGDNVWPKTNTDEEMTEENDIATHQTDRLYKRQQTHQSSEWSWSSLSWTSKDTDNLKTSLEIVKEDLLTIYFALLSAVCLLVPRETTSIISAVFLILAGILTFCYSKTINNQKKKRRKTTVKAGSNNQNEDIIFKEETDVLTKSRSSKPSGFRNWLMFWRRGRNPAIKAENSTQKGDTNVTRTTYLYPTKLYSLLSFKKCLILSIFLIFLVSILFEYGRLFDIEVAKRMAVIVKRLPSECYPERLTITERVRYWMSWKHDPCEKYHTAVLVDPLWEINPLMVLSSVITRSLNIGFRLFFNEIPAHWQPIMLIVIVLVFLLTIVRLCGYRISLPLILKIEPKTPVSCKTKSHTGRDSIGGNSKTNKVDIKDKKQKEYSQDSHDKYE